MICQLTGVLLEKNTNQVVLDVGGVGYEISVPTTTYLELPNVGELLTLHTQMVIKENAQDLFGFYTKADKVFFREILNISGVGAKKAITALSAMSAAEFIQAVERDDAKMLSKIPSFGIKSAERIVLDMKPRLKNLYASNLFSSTPKNLPNSVSASTLKPTETTLKERAINALSSDLGFTKDQSTKAVNKAIAIGFDCDHLQGIIRAALRAI